MKKKGQPGSMQAVGDILIQFNPLEDKYISREFQAYGFYLAESLDDLKHRGIYMRLAKTMPRALLEKALSFVKDADVKHKGALFMWKLKEMGAWVNSKKAQKHPPAGGQKEKDDIPF